MAGKCLSATGFLPCVDSFPAFLHLIIIFNIFWTPFFTLAVFTRVKVVAEYVQHGKTLSALPNLAFNVSHLPCAVSEKPTRVVVLYSEVNYDVANGLK